MTHLQQTKRIWPKIWVITFLLVATTLLTINFTVAKNTGNSSELRTVFETIALLKTQYVEPLDTLDLVGAYVREGSIDGMLETMLDDPYTYYLDADAFHQMQISIEGTFGGIGILVGIRDNDITIIAPIDGTPGDKAGLLGGDRIISVDGRSTDALSLDEAVSLMRGPEDSTVRLGIERTVKEESERFEIDIVREMVEVDSVSQALVLEPSDQFSFLEDRIGYIRISNFSIRTDGELLEALHDAVHKEQVAGIILDLRDNGGGVFPASLEVANQFIAEGPLVHIVGRNGQTETHHAHPENAFAGLPPLVVLVNEYSASASEIVAGALQDHGKAVLIGETTFGKGLVQTIFPLRSGALSLTTDRYQTAGGRFIHEDGIEPDIYVPWTTEERLEATYLDELGGLSPDDPQLIKALEVLQDYVYEASYAQAS